ncbi:MAG: insulinase family protein [Candidatus Eremiobacteraeota bacterium]|nr:insulinase family protein [Candidatus Eremiobacteraeota bacterium]
MYAKSTLPNGIRIVTERIAAVRSAAIGIWADVGSACERPEQRGISHLVEHMLFKGTARRSAREIAETMDRVGGNLNAFTDKESTCYYARVIDRHVPLAIDVLGDMFLASRFDPEDVRREQSVVLEEIKMYDDSPDEVIHDLFVRLMWSNSKLGDPVIGFPHTIAALRSEDLRAHMRERYVPRNVVVTVAGNVEHEAIVAEFERTFGGFEGNESPPVPERVRLSPGSLVVTRDVEQVYLIVGTRGLPAADEDRYALSVIDTALGGGMSSRLFQEIREERGLAYSVGSFQLAYRDAGLFAVSAGTSVEHAQETIGLIREAFRETYERGLGTAEIELAKEHLKGSLTLALESVSGRMMRLGRNELTFGRQIDEDELEKKIDAVGVADVRRLAQSIFAPESWGLCVLGPIDENDIDWTPAVA